MIDLDGDPEGPASSNAWDASFGTTTPSSRPGPGSRGPAHIARQGLKPARYDEPPFWTKAGVVNVLP